MGSLLYFCKSKCDMRGNDGKPIFSVGGFFAKGLKVALLFELGSLVVSYAFYRKLNTNQG